MATRILMADVSSFVENTLLEIRAGLEAANTAGISVEIPEKVTFAFEIVSAAQSLDQVTETSTSDTTTNPNETTTETVSGNEVTTEAAVTDTETTSRVANVVSAESGADLTDTVNTWDEYIDS